MRSDGGERGRRRWDGMAGSTAPPCNRAALIATKSAPATAIPDRLAGLAGSAITPSNDEGRATARLAVARAPAPVAMPRPGPETQGTCGAAAPSAAAGHYGDAGRRQPPPGKGAAESMAMTPGLGIR